MKPTEFLDVLWGPNPPGLMTFWRLRDKRTFYLTNTGGATALCAGEHDIYTAVATTHKDLGPRRRPTAKQATSIAGLWIDLDVDGGPDQKTGAIPTVQDALDLAHEIAEPTIIINSGYGLHAWWLFEQPYTFAGYPDQDHAQKMSAQWYALHRSLCTAHGWGLDHTHDLARILRLPATTNAKGGQTAPVDVVEHGGDRYDIAHLAELCARAGELPEARVAEHVEISLDAELNVVAFTALLNSNRGFARAWAHEANADWTMSEHDLALCSHAAAAGWSNDQLAALIAEHRRARREGVDKASRADYLERTIGRARETQDPASGQPDTPVVAQPAATPEGWGDIIFAALTAKAQPTTPTPFPAFNDALDGGLRAGEVAIISGHTSHGKSIVVDQFADTAAAAGKRVHLYLTEMTAVQRGMRLLARRTGVSLSALKRRELSREDWLEINAQLATMPYGCSIVSDWSVDDVVDHVRENQWDMAVVDLIHGFHYTDERDLSKNSSALMRAAKGWHPGTIVLAAAHLNDGQVRESRSPVRPRPGLNWIKGASSIKQDADVVMFVWRQDDEDGTPTVDGEVWIQKNRDGGFAHALVVLDTGSMTFVEPIVSYA